MKVNKTYSVLIVTHNHEDTIGALLDSLEKNKILSVYICDAVSSDETVDIIKESIFCSKLLVQTKLESFSKNNNDLIRHFNLNTNYYVILNPDTEVIEDVFTPISEFLEKNPEYLIGVPQLVYPDLTVQNAWKTFPGVSTFLRRRFGFISNDKSSNLEKDNLEYALGACLIVNQSLSENGKLLDERYRLYCEDIDLCFKAHFLGGKIKGFKEHKVIHHYQSQNTKKVFSRHNYWNIQSAIKFLIKWNYKYIRLLKLIRANN